MVKWFHQRQIFCFYETFNPAVKLAAIRVALTLALSKNWGIRQLDVNNALLGGVFQEEVFMEQTARFENKN